MSEVIPDDVPEESIWHVYPIGDLRDHHTDGRGDCWCRPEIACIEGGWLVVHAAADGREDFETGVRKPS